LNEAARGFLIEALGYNNLLAFPYLYGYDAPRLAKCAERFDFETEGMLNSKLITLPLPEDPDWVEQEEHLINEELRLMAEGALADRGGTLAGPWLEAWFRNANGSVTKLR
jgi:hypothetical protein